MTIKKYVKEYTAGKRICFSDVLREIKEFFIEIFKIEIFKFNKQGIVEEHSFFSTLRFARVSEEFQDVLHFLQLWLYWRFGIDGEFWGITKKSVAKFMNRKKVWQEIYEFVGLDKRISGYVGNYNKIEKVIKHLSQFGISEEKAKEAYEKVALGKIVENKFKLFKIRR